MSLKDKIGNLKSRHADVNYEEILWQVHSQFWGGGTKAPQIFEKGLCAILTTGRQPEKAESTLSSGSEFRICHQVTVSSGTPNLFWPKFLHLLMKDKMNSSLFVTP